MSNSLKLLASETLMCGLKAIPIAGKAFELVDAVSTRHEILSHGDKIRELEGQLTRMERRLRDLVEEEIRATLGQLGQPDLDGRALTEEIRNLRQIQEQGWEPALFEGLLRNSNHLAELRRNPQHYGQVLDRHAPIDPTKMHILIDADPLRILELYPFAFAALLANQSRGVPSARIESAADIWAFPSAADGPGSASAEAEPTRREAGAASVWLGPGAANELVPSRNALGMTMVPIRPGAYLRGTSSEQLDLLLRLWPHKPREAFDDEQPRRRIEIRRPFALAAHPVTVGQFAQFVEATGYVTEAERDDAGCLFWNGSQWTPEPGKTWRTPGFHQEADHPVVATSFHDAAEFLAWLNVLEPGRGYRLPTEAEWEYACRAGTEGLYGASDDPESLVRFANVADASFRILHPEWPCLQGDDGYIHTSPVGSFQPNAWGLYDMIGNVCEWCGDWYAARSYDAPTEVDPPGADQGTSRVIRGSGWFSEPAHGRPAFRDRRPPSNRSTYLGLRPAAER